MAAFWHRAPSGDATSCPSRARRQRDACAGARAEKSTVVHPAAHPEPAAAGARATPRHSPPDRGADGELHPNSAAATIAVAPPPGLPARPGDVTVLAPNIVSVQHWDRLLGGLLYATSPRVDWASLLRRSFSVDVLECPKCRGRLKVVAVITEREPVQRILAHLGLPTDAPPVARARDPTDELDDDEALAQLSLNLV